MRPPLVSKRVSFRWLSDPPTEPTSTLVLTSPSGYFVDVRIFNAPEYESSAFETTTPTPEPLQWAFAGTSSHDTIDPESDGQPQSRGTWVHVVDSKHPSGFEDSGVFKDLPNGYSLEFGVMHDDGAGVAREYEEVWKDWAARPPHFTVARAESAGEVVEGGGTKGYYICMAQYAQGVVKDENGRLGVVRWVKDSGTDAQEWTKKFTHGEIHEWLPSPTSIRRNGGLACAGPCKWVIIEEYPSTDVAQQIETCE